MTQIPAGWYPDPSPQNQSGSGMRYWDGNGWTEQVSDPGTPPPPAYPQPPAPPQAPTYPQAPQDPAYSAYPAYPTYPAGDAQYQGNGPTTPDGQRLSGWWMRVLAAFLDGLFVLPLMALAVAPVLASQWDNINAWVDQHTVNGTFTFHTGDRLPAAFDATTGPGLAFFASIFAASALYTLLFLGWKQATPGKLATGLRIRLRQTPGLPWSAIMARWGMVTVLGMLYYVPVLGILAGITLLLDYLWPLWDKNNQALHDKVARTNVVKKN